MGYIGGGFGKGIHNSLEAAVFGMPLFFGPRYQKFREARELVATGAAFEIADARELITHFDRLCQDATYLKECAEKSRTYVAQRTGATEKIRQKIAPYLNH